MRAFGKGLLIGFAVGYVQGTKAGKERYRQIKNGIDKLGVGGALGKVVNRWLDLVTIGYASARPGVSRQGGKPASTAEDPLHR